MKFSVYLIKKESSSYRDLLKEDASYDLFDISDDYDFNVMIALGACKEREPEWINFIKEALNDDIPEEYKNKSTRSIIFVELSDYYMAYTFGFGRHLLNDSLIVKDFGIKVALNNVNPNKLKGMDKLTLSDNMMQQRIQSARSANFVDFSVDKSKDFLRTIAGETLSDVISKRLLGSDSIQFTQDIEFNDLGEYSQKLLNSYISNAYKKNFSWFDNMQFERNKNTIGVLDKALIAKLEVGEGVYLVAPEIVDDLYVEQMSMTEQGDLVSFDIESVIKFFSEKKIEFNLDTLNKRYIYVSDSEDENGKLKWKLYNCLLTEVEHDGLLYSLMMGMWFKVSKDYESSVISYLKTIDSSKVTMPKAKKGEWEGKYSIRVEDENKNDFVLMDVKLVDDVEVCDLLTVNKQFIHIKPWKSSSTLSHLFSQGRVASTLLLEDSAFRRKTKDLIRSIDVKFDCLDISSFNPSDFEIVYAVIYKEDKEVIDRIPFFSKINLMHNVKVLRAMGFFVTLKHIEIEM